MKTIGTYGSLKKGCYNYDRFDMEHNAAHIGNTTIRGAMDLMGGQYPRLYPEGYMPEAETDHVLEVYDITEELYERLDYMEVGAGYQSHVLNVEINGAQLAVTVWLMNPAYEIDLEAYIKSYPINDSPLSRL